MRMPVSKAISIFLPEGEARGIRIAGVSNHVVRAIAFPRNKLDRATTRSQLSGVGVYFLFGQREDAAQQSVYIGRTESCRDRLTQHNSDPRHEFWQSTVVVVSESGTFTTAHVQMLECESIRRSQSAGRYRVENANGGSAPHLTESMRSEVDEVIEDMDLLLGCLGFAVFDPVSTAASKSGGSDELPEFSYRGSTFNGRLVWSPDGFVVLAGSVARAESVPSAREWLDTKRQLLIDGGTLERRENGYRFTRDHVFASPSAAAAIIGGGAANGWDAWLDGQGRSLDKVYRSSDA